MIEIELRKILVTITELSNYFNNETPPKEKSRVFLLNAPELTPTPYAVYTMNRSEEEYILDGVTGNRVINFDINIYSDDTIKLKTIAYKVREKLLSLLGTTIVGTYETFLIQDVKVSMSDFYDSTVNLYRSIVELEIYI